MWGKVDGYEQSEKVRVHYPYNQYTRGDYPNNMYIDSNSAGL